MSEAENLYGDEHVKRYRETGGEVGHIWKKGSKTLLLTTKGRKSGQPRTTPLIYEQTDDDKYVIVASKGGAPEDPGWYENLAKDPQVELQVKDEVFPARAHTAEGEEREQMWKLAAQQWPDYDQYQTKTDREIPVVVLERSS
jgi:proline iminopeptidase